MSVVTVQVGQCGNALGAAFFSALAEEAAAGLDDFRRCTEEAFFRQRSRSDGAASPACTARSVLVDMEPKVIASALLSKKEGWAYSERSALVFQSGSGNNWARGYNTFGPQCRDRLCDLVRRETEACDSLSGFLILQSTAGGTGAGLGAYAADALRDEYPSACVLNHCIWPYDVGEVVVQSYNTLLTLAGLLDTADGVLLVSNEALHATAASQLHTDRPSFDDLNRVAAKNLASILLPASWRALGANGDPPGGSKPRSLLGETVERLCSQPQLRLLSLFAVPHMPQQSVEFSTFSWPSLIRRLRSSLSASSQLPIDGLSARQFEPPPSRIVAAALTLRGKDAGVADVTSLADAALFSTLEQEPLSVAWHPSRFSRYEMAASLLANSSCVVQPAQRVLDRARSMFSARAYCWQYEAHGLALVDFETAFRRVEDAVDAYSAL